MRALHATTPTSARSLEDLDEPDRAAVEEFVRWATPVMTFRRTATRDTEIAGQQIAEGEKVVMFYALGQPRRDGLRGPRRASTSTREPNHHVGFGGGGPHYCLGASLARTQLRAIFGELLERGCPGIEVAGSPSRCVGNFINGVKRLPCSWAPAA